jgi:hypothetical protein
MNKHNNGGEGATFAEYVGLLWVVGACPCGNAHGRVVIGVWGMGLLPLLLLLSSLLATCPGFGTGLVRPCLLRLVGRSVRRARGGVILKSTTNKGGLL